jgi:hypothetical protein
MKSPRAFSRVPRLLAAAAVMSTMAVGALAVTSMPVSAAALGTPTWTLSNNTPGASSVQYTVGFTATATTGSPTSITYTFPTGTTATTPTLSSSYGFGTDTVAISVATNVLTVTLTGGASIPSGQFVAVAVSGFNNIATTGSASVTIAETPAGDTGTATTTIAANTTTATVYVPESLTLSNVTQAIGLTPLPNGSPVTAPVNVNVSTNALHGYTLSAISTALTGPATWAATSNSASAAFAANTSAFGARATAVGGGTGAPTVTTPFNGGVGSYVGYNTLFTSGNVAVAADAGPASQDTITITNAAQASAVQAAGAYTGTITYQATPGY